MKRVFNSILALLLVVTVLLSCAFQSYAYVGTDDLKDSPVENESVKEMSEEESKEQSKEKEDVVSDEESEEKSDSDDEDDSDEKEVPNENYQEESEEETKDPVDEELLQEEGQIILKEDEPLTKASSYFEGDGSSDNPFKIQNAQDLIEMSEHFYELGSDHNFELCNNIVFNHDIDDIENVMKPIPSDSYLKFDGKGYTIYGLCLNGNNEVALFDKASEVKDLTVEDAIITVKAFDDGRFAPRYIASVIAVSTRNASNCLIKGDVRIVYESELARDSTCLSAGGLFCTATNAEDCQMNADLQVQVNGKGQLHLGGIAYNGSFKRCDMTGTISAMGRDVIASGVTDQGTADNCKAGYETEDREFYIKVSSENTNSGIACGIAYVADCSHCTNYATLDAPCETVGIADSPKEAVCCKNYGTQKKATTRVGIIRRGAASHCSNYGDIRQIDGEDNCDIYGIVKEQNCDGVDNCNYGNLAGYNVYGIVGTFAPEKKGEDITLSGCSNYGKLEALHDAFGVVGYVGLSKSDYSRWGNNTIVSDCTNEGVVSGLISAGIAGYQQYGATISKCFNLEDIVSTWSAAGITYTMGCYSKILNCSNSGGIRAGSGYNAGGIVQNLYSYDTDPPCLPMVSGCNNSGEISGSNAGGIAGQFGLGVITECSNDGDISAGSSGAGIIASIFISRNNTANVISNCYNAGFVSGSSKGGITGYLSIYDSNSTLDISNCYNVGTHETGTFYHIVGDSYLPSKTGINISGCYYISDGAGGIYLKSGETESGMQRCSDSELKMRSTFTGWDFDSVWTMGSEPYSYPVLINSGDTKYTITFDPNGGTVSVGTMITTGRGNLASLPKARLAGMQFAGWYTLADGGERVTAATIFSDNTTVYAHWKVYDPNDRVTISPINPKNGDGRVSYVDDGGFVNFKISFSTSVPVKDIDLTEGSIRISEYDTDTVIYEVSNKKEVTLKNDGSGTVVSFAFMNGGLTDGRKYYIEIDDGFLQFEDEALFSFCEKDDWVFNTGSKVYYLSEQGTICDKTLPYLYDIKDEYFCRSSYELNWDLAMIAYGMTLSAFETHNNNNYSLGYVNAKRTLESFGFDNFSYNYGYTVKPSIDSIAVSAASREIDDNGKKYTVIALPIRGAGYEAEWASNVTVSKENYHKGFKSAADQVVSFLRDYINEYDITGDIKVIVTGYSRAGGTANVVASLLDDGAISDISQISIDRSSIYGFCFEPPAVTTKPDSHKSEYQNIYSFINPKDIVPKVPSPYWGYQRFGRELYYPDAVTSSKAYEDMYPGFLENYRSLSGTEYDQTPFRPTCGDSSSLRFWTKDLIDGLSMDLTRSDYVDNVQYFASDLLKHGLDIHLDEFNVNGGNMEKVIGLVLYLLRYKTQINIGSFLAFYSDNKNNPVEGYNNLIHMFTSHDSLSELIMQEHYPLVNLAWLISCKDKNFYTDGSFKYMIVNCPVDVRVYDSSTGNLVAEIVNDEAKAIEQSPVSAFIDRNGQKVFVVPTDRSYEVKVVATDEGEVNYSLLDGNESEGYTRRVDYTCIEVMPGDELLGTLDLNGTYELKKDGSTCQPEVQTDIIWQEVNLTAEENGTVFGSGTYMKNEFVIARAIPDAGAEFDGWYDEDENLVSNESDLRFRVETDVQYKAKFREIDGILFTAVEDQVYTGAAIKPDLGVYDGTRKLTAGKDYTVAYKNNKNAYELAEGDEGFNVKKAPSITVKMMGNYAGSRTVYFRIKKGDISSDTFRADDMSVLFNKKKQTPAPVLLNGKTKLKLGTDYTVVEYDDNKKNGAAFKGVSDADTGYALTLRGKGNYTGERVIKLNILGTKVGEAQRVLIGKVAVSAIPVQTYSGESFTSGNLLDKKGNPFTFKLTYNKKYVLEEGRDYELTYENNREIGTATVVIKGLEDDNNPYSFFGTRSVTFKIQGAAINKAAVQNLRPSYVFTGEMIRPTELQDNPVKLAMRIGNTKNFEELTEGTDYEVQYSANTVKVGRVTITFTGKGRFSGSLKKTFNITASPLAIKGIKADYVAVNSQETVTSVYSKGGAKPNPTVSWNGKVLTAGQDYNIKYSDNGKVYTDNTFAAKKPPMMTITGKGNYSGSFKVPFLITSKQFSKDCIKVVVKDKEENGKKNGYTTSFTLYDEDGKKLAAGADYEKAVVYTLISDGDQENINRQLDKNDIVRGGSVIRITVTGKGKYTADSIDFTYRILEKGYDIAKARFGIYPQKYTGREVTLKAEDVQLAVMGKATTLTYGIDFEFDESTYKNNISKGTAKVTVVGKGRYGGSKEITFKLGTRNISDFWKGFCVKIEDLFG